MVLGFLGVKIGSLIRERFFYYNTLSMKRILVALIIINFAAAGFCADKYIISGKVLDSITKEPVEGALVALKEDNTKTNAAKDGSFKLETERTSVTLLAEIMGYKKYKEKLVTPYKDATIELELAANYTLSKVYVREKARNEGTKQKVPVQQIKETTTQLFSDSLKVLQTFPGVVTGNDFSSLMYIRGGEFYESVSFLDNIYIIMPYMWGGSQSIFNPAFVDKIDFYTGGFPVKYQQALSAVIDVKNIEGDFQKKSGYVEVSPTTFEIFSQGPMTPGKSSYVFGFRRTYYDLMIKLLYGNKFGDTVFPFFYDSQAKFVWKLNDRDKLSLDIIASYEGMDFDSSKIEGTDPERQFKFNYGDKRLLPGLNFERVYDDQLSLNFTLSTRYQEGSYDFASKDAAATSASKMYDLYLKNKVTYITGNHTIEQGVYFFRTWLNFTDTSNFRTLMPDGSYFYDSKNDEFSQTTLDASGFYLQDDFALIPDKLSINFGVLVENFDYTNDSQLASRGGVKYNLNDTMTLKFNTGLYTEYPVNSGNGIPPILRNRDIKAEKAMHYILGFEEELPNNYFLRLETYRKDYFDLTVQDPDPNIYYTNNGIRKVYGADAFLQKKISEKWDGWFAYSYLYARDRIEQRNDPANYAGKSALNYLQPVGEWYPFEKERTHNLSLVFNCRLSKKYKLAATYRFSTGTHYTEVIGSVQNGTTYAPLYGKYLDQTMPNYSRLDVKLTIYNSKDKDLETFIQAINLLGNDNVDSYYYSSDYKTRHESKMLPFIPIAGINYKF
jgi:hypothetical protein